MASVYDSFNDEYGVDSVRERYGASNYTIDRELRRRQRDLEQKAADERLYGVQLQNAKLLAGEAYQNKERVDIEAQATDVLGAISDVRDPREIVGLLRDNRKAINDPTVTSAVNNKFKEFERFVEINEKAAALGGYFGDYQAAIEQGAAPEEAFTATQVQRGQDVTRSELEGLGVKPPDDPKEMERLAARARAMEPDIATRQMLSADISRLTKIVEDIEADPEERAAALVDLQTARKTMLGARALAEPTGPGRLSSSDFINLFQPSGN